jgi:hypothetical protein
MPRPELRTCCGSRGGGGAHGVGVVTLFSFRTAQRSTSHVGALSFLSPGRRSTTDRGLRRHRRVSGRRRHRRVTCGSRARAAPHHHSGRAQVATRWHCSAAHTHLPSQQGMLRRGAWRFPTSFRDTVRWAATGTSRPLHRSVSRAPSRTRFRDALASHHVGAPLYDSAASDPLRPHTGHPHRIRPTVLGLCSGGWRRC